MSKRAETYRKLEALAAPNSGATDGERAAALAAMERIGFQPWPTAETEFDGFDVWDLMEELCPGWRKRYYGNYTDEQFIRDRQEQDAYFGIPDPIPVEDGS